MLCQQQAAAVVGAVVGARAKIVEGAVGAEMLRDCDASGELSKIIAFGADSGRALVFAGDADSVCMGFSGWQVDAKRARRECFTAPQTLPEGDQIGVRLTHGHTRQPARLGAAC
jgi:hypothetical protein